MVLCQGCVLGVLLGQSSALLSGCWREGSKISKRAVSKLGTQQSTGNCLFQQEANGFGGPLILRRNGCTFIKTISQRAPERVVGRGSFPLRTTFCWGRAESCSFWFLGVLSGIAYFSVGMIVIHGTPKIHPTSIPGIRIQQSSLHWCDVCSKIMNRGSFGVSFMRIPSHTRFLWRFLAQLCLLKAKVFWYPLFPTKHQDRNHGSHGGG